MNKDMLRQFAVIMATSGTLAVNSISQVLPWNEKTSAEIANRFLPQVYFLPANYVFSIWGIIYIGLIAFTIFQALPSQRENPRLKTVGWLYVLSCVMNSVWLWLFHFDQFWISTVAMVVLLASLVAIYVQLRRGNPQISQVERWITRLPFSLYLGWISVATIANFTFALMDGGQANLFGLATETWVAVMIVVGAVIAGTFAYLNRDIAYAAVIVWAFVGLIARYPTVNVVVLAAGLMALAVALAGIVGFVSNLRGGGGSSTPVRASAMQ
jgi:hypothetical protein